MNDIESPELERYKLITVEVLKSLGGIADTRQLADTAMLSMDDVPPDDPDYDYASLSRVLRQAREALLQEGKVTCSNERIWRLVRTAGRTNAN